MSELDAEHIPDNILSEIILDLSIQNAYEAKESEPKWMQADTSVAIRPRQCSNENSFKSLDTEEIDDIGGKNL